MVISFAATFTQSDILQFVIDWPKLIYDRRKQGGVQSFARFIANHVL